MSHPIRVRFFIVPDLGGGQTADFMHTTPTRSLHFLIDNGSRRNPNRRRQYLRNHWSAQSGLQYHLQPCSLSLDSNSCRTKQTSTRFNVPRLLTMHHIATLDAHHHRPSTAMASKQTSPIRQRTPLIAADIYGPSTGAAVVVSSQQGDEKGTSIIQNISDEPTALMHPSPLSCFKSNTTINHLVGGSIRMYYRWNTVSSTCVRHCTSEVSKAWTGGSTNELNGAWVVHEPCSI